MVVVVVLVVDSGEAAGLAAGAAVSVFSWQAASSAAPAKMQMYFFIIFWFEMLILSLIVIRSKLAFQPQKSADHDQRLQPTGLKMATDISSRALRPPPGRSIFHHGC